MSLVKCNHCSKETINNTGKCRWCNKELHKNSDVIKNKWTDIDNKVKEEKKVTEKKNKKDNFWICKQCNAENEINIQVCWKCKNVNKMTIPQKIKKTTGQIALLIFIVYWICYFHQKSNGPVTSLDQFNDNINDVINPDENLWVIAIVFIVVAFLPNLYQLITTGEFKMPNNEEDAEEDDY